jgi:hypothetical protein
VLQQQGIPADVCRDNQEDQPVTKKTLAAAVGALALLGAACGGSGGGSGDATKIADKIMTSAKDDGMELDKSCVTKLAEKFNDADTEMLVDNLDNEDFDLDQLSDEGAALGMQLIGCADKDALVDMMMEEIGEMPGADPECIRAALDKLDTDALIELGESEGDPSSSSGEALMTDVMACLTGS